MIARTLPDTTSQSRARRAGAAARAGLLLAALALGCTREPDATPRTARIPTPLDSAATGTIRGTIRYVGAAPRSVPAAIASDPACAALHPDGLAIAEVRGTDGGLADAFVYLARGLEERVFAVPEAPVVIDQRKCLFVPRVAGVQAGQAVRFTNGDPTLHNVHGVATRSASWNFGLAVSGAERTRVFAEAEIMIEVRCDVHPWMRAHLGVVDHPYFAVTGPDGRFKLAGVPEGAYVVAVWHERLGRRERAVEVIPKGATLVDFTYPP